MPPKPDPAKDGKPIPDAWWEMLELAMNRCPEVPLKAFRKSMIGRGKPLTASQADSAIKAAENVLATGMIREGQTARGRKRELVLETESLRMIRAGWYIRTGLPLVLARKYGHTWNPEELDLARDAKAAGLNVKCLQWDDYEVHRTEIGD